MVGDPAENRKRVQTYNAAGFGLGPSWEIGYWSKQQILGDMWNSTCRVPPCKASAWAPPCCSTAAAAVSRPVVARASFPMYDPLPTTGVAWSTSDAALSQLLTHAETSEASNGHVFYAPQPPLPEPFTVLVEGAQYIGAWLETQPMAGAMWATRSVRLALDNQLVFMRTPVQPQKIVLFLAARTLTAEGQSRVTLSLR